MDLEPPRQAFAQFQPARQQWLDAGDGAVQVAALGRRQLTGEHQTGVLRQQQQLGALPGRLLAQGGEVLGVGIPGGEKIDVVLAGGNLDHGVSSFSQNDMGLADSSASSRSRQW